MVETVLVLHGTFANHASWWRAGGSFCAQLDQLLEAHGSDARCWAHLREGESEFQWDGRNSQMAREAAARSLGGYIDRVCADGRVSKLHLVCHSHGGNVLLYLKRHLNTANGMRAVLYGTKIFLGTPFYEFSPVRVSLAGTSGLDMLLYFPTSLAAVVSYFYYSRALIAAFCLLLLPFLVKFLLRPFSLAGPTSRLFWGRDAFLNRNAIFSFEYDEAARVLQTAATYWNHPPKHLISQEQKWQGLIFGRNRYVYSSLFLYFARFLTSAPAVQESELATFSFRKIVNLEVTAIKDSVAKLNGPDFGSSVSTIFDTAIVLLLFPVGLALNLVRAFFVIGADWLILAPIVWITPAVREFAIRRGLYAAAASALGIDAVGWRVASVCRVPPTNWVVDFESVGLRNADRVWNLATISKDVELEATKRATEYLAASSGRLYPLGQSRGSPDIEIITLADLASIFQDINILHNQYYQSEWIISEIARYIRKNDCDDNWWFL